MHVGKIIFFHQGKLEAPAPTNLQLWKWQGAEKMPWPQWPFQLLLEHHMCSPAC